jgi:hypothetical protein
MAGDAGIVKQFIPFRPQSSSWRNPAGDSPFK